MALYTDPAVEKVMRDSRRELSAFLSDFDRRLCDLVKHVQQVRIPDSQLPRFIKGETIREGGQS